MPDNNIERLLPRVSLKEEIEKAEKAGDIKKAEGLKKKEEEATKRVRFNWLKKLMKGEKNKE